MPAPDDPAAVYHRLAFAGRANSPSYQSPTHPGRRGTPDTAAPRRKKLDGWEIFSAPFAVFLKKGIPSTRPRMGQRQTMVPSRAYPCRKAVIQSSSCCCSCAIVIVITTAVVCSLSLPTSRYRTTPNTCFYLQLQLQAQKVKRKGAKKADAPAPRQKPKPKKTKDSSHLQTGRDEKLHSFLSVSVVSIRRAHLILPVTCGFVVDTHIAWICDTRFDSAYYDGYTPCLYHHPPPPLPCP